MTDNEFNRISEQYIDIVYRSAINICKNKSDAEDAVQNTFLKLLKSDIDFENEDHIRRWLIRVAVNECKNIWKSPWNKKISSFEELEKEPVYIENPIISVKYVNNDGSVITEKSFDKSILEKTTSDVNSSDEKSVQVKSCQLTTFYGW